VRYLPNMRYRTLGIIYVRIQPTAMIIYHIIIHLNAHIAVVVLSNDCAIYIIIGLLFIYQRLYNLLRDIGRVYRMDGRLYRPVCLGRKCAVHVEFQV